MKKLSLLFIAAALFFSCNKQSDHLTVTLNQSGVLSVKVIDNNGNTFQGAKVSIYSSIPEDERIYYDSTDVSGICDVGNVLQGQYKYFVTAEKDNKIYQISESFQLISTENKTLEINPFINVGDVSVRIVNSYYSTPVANVNVAIIPTMSYYGYGYSFEDLFNEASSITQTDENGWCKFTEMPGGRYIVMVYTDSSNYETISETIYITRDSNKEYTFRVYNTY